MQKFNTLSIIFILLSLFTFCKQTGTSVHAKKDPSSTIMTDSTFEYVKEFDHKKYAEGIGTSASFHTRLKQLVGDQYEQVILPMQKGNPEGILADDFWFTLYAEYEKEGVRFQSTIVADLAANTLCAGYWDSGSEQLKSFCEKEDKVPPPYQAWLDDSN